MKMTGRIEYHDLGRMSYGEALELQREAFASLLEQRDAGDGPAGTVFTVEHPPVYTLGRNGNVDNMLVSRERLQASGAEFFRTDRGGDITFHGEGQIVCYPIMDLSRVGIGLRRYIWLLEEAVMATVAAWGIETCRSEGASGVWIAGSECGGHGSLRKICAIGVRSSHGVTMHGLALNVTTDLSRFEVINPCGFTDRGVTSMFCELGYAPDIAAVRHRLVEELTLRLGAKQGGGR